MRLFGKRKEAVQRSLEEEILLTDIDRPLDDIHYYLWEQLFCGSIRITQQRTGKQKGIRVSLEDLDQTWLNLMKKWQGKKLSEILREREKINEGL